MRTRTVTLQYVARGRGPLHYSTSRDDADRYITVRRVRTRTDLGLLVDAAEELADAPRAERRRRARRPGTPRPCDAMYRKYTVMYCDGREWKGMEMEGNGMELLAARPRPCGACVRR